MGQFIEKTSSMLNSFAWKLGAILSFIGCAVSILVAIIVIFIDRYITIQSYFDSGFLLPNIVLIIVAILPILFFDLFEKLVEKINPSFLEIFYKVLDRWFVIFALLFFSLLLSVQFRLTNHIWFGPGWDVSIVMGEAHNIAFNGGHLEHYYFSQYTNNIFLVAILSWVKKLWIVMDWVWIYPILRCAYVGCIIVNLSGLFMVLSVRKLTTNWKNVLFSLFLYVVLVGLSPWMIIPYSDTYGILFPVLTFYLYLQAKETALLLRITLWFLMGLAGLVGYYIKPYTIIVLIACIVIELLRFFTVEKVVKTKIVLSLLVLVLSFLCSKQIWNQAVEHVGIEINEDLNMTYAHYLMLGHNIENTGAYHSPDYAFSSNQPDVETRHQANLEVTRQRIANMGVLGYGSFLVRKLILNFNDGTFSWWKEGGFLLYENPEPKLTRMHFILKDIYRADGKWHEYYRVTAQTVWLLLLICLVGFFRTKRGNGKDKESSKDQNGQEKCYWEKQVLILAMLGMFLAVMLFEARARYLFVFAPIYIIMGSMGMENVGLKLKGLLHALQNFIQRIN